MALRQSKAKQNAEILTISMLFVSIPSMYEAISQGLLQDVINPVMWKTDRFNNVYAMALDLPKKYHVQ